MFGVYSNKRLSENERAILNSHPDDYNWYMVIVSCVFRDRRFFEVREDIELPQNEDDEGVVLIFEGGNPVYFKILEGDVTDNEIKSIFKVCSFLEDKFNCPIDSYVLCKPDCKINGDKGNCEGDIRIFFSFICSDDGEEIVERLLTKLKNREKFTISDSVDHMLLPYVGYKNKMDFQAKYDSYMKCIDEYDGE